MAVIQGFTRMRAHQIGKQTVHGTAVAASRKMPWGGVPDINPNWTDVEGVDQGSIDPVLTPYRTQTDITIPYSGPLDYNSIHVIGGSAWRGGVAASGGGAAKTWTQQAVSLTATTLDELTDEWGDDVTGDGVRIRDIVFEEVELGFDESLGPWQFSGTGRGGYFDPRVAPTSLGAIGSNLPLVFGADTALYIDDTAGGIGGTLISDALHRASVRIGNTVDQKRFAQGSNTRFQIDGYGLSGREVTASFTFAKQSNIISSTGEVADLHAASAVSRYLKIAVTSPAVIPGTATPYSWDLRLAGTWRVRADEDIGGNAVIRLDFTGKYDSGLGYILYSSVVNDRATNP